MITLTIRKADNSIYWTEYFNSVDEANKWLDIERTRSYWIQSYTTQIIDNTPPQPEKDAAAAAELLRKTKIAEVVQNLRDLHDIPVADLTNAHLKAISVNTLKLMKLRKDLD
jgi:hypothetical protein